MKSSSDDSLADKAGQTADTTATIVNINVIDSL
jgi:hypothetical protein